MTTTDAALTPLEGHEHESAPASIDATRGPSGRPRRPLRAVALPSEHGGWALAIEPVLLGLLIAPSTAGLSIGAAALLAFLARTPLKVVLVDSWRRRWLRRTSLALAVFAGEFALIVTLLALATRTADSPFLAALITATPLLAVQLWFDMRSRSRRLLPELAGTTGIAAVATAIALAGGATTSTAIGAWLLITARAFASLPFVHHQLRRAKHRSTTRWHSDSAQASAIALGGIGLALGWLPLVGTVALACLAAIQLVLSRRPAPRAVVVGSQQLVLGLGVVLATGLAAP